MAYVPPLNGGRINASIGGNSTSAGAGYSYISTGDMILAGGNNITLSQNGKSISIVGGAAGGSINFSAGTTSGNLASVTFADSNGVGFGLNAGTITASYTQSNQALSGSNGSFTFQTATFGNSNGLSFYSTNGSMVGSYTVPTQTNQTLSLAMTSNTAGNTSGMSVDARSLTFQGMGIASVGLSTSAGGSSVIVSASQTVQTQNLFDLVLSGNTAGAMATVSSGTMTLAGGNNITLSQNGNAVTISGGAGGSPNFSAGTTSNNLGSVVFSNSNGVSFGLNGSTITGSIATSLTNVNFSAGTTSGNLSNIVFSNSNGVSFGLNGSTITASAAGGAGGGVALYDGANSITSGTAQLSNANGVSFGFNGQTITGSVAAQSNQTLGIYATGANTIGQSSSSTYDARSLNVSGQGGFSAGWSGSTLQMSAPATSSLAVTGALSITTNGSTISFGAPQTSSLSVTGGLSVSTNASTISLGIIPMSQWMHNSAALYSSSTSAMVNTSVSIVRMLLPYNLSFSRVDIPVSISGATSATANTAAMALSAVGVIYSRNGSTLNPIVGQSSTTTYSYASNTGVYSSITGPRMLSFNLATSLTAGEYYLGFQMSSNTSSVGTATTNLGWTLAPVFGTSYTVLPWQGISAATNQTINLYQPLQGMNNVSISNTTQTMQQSQITQSGATAIRANLVVILRNN